MKQCELEQVKFVKGEKEAKRTGLKKVAFLDVDSSILEGSIIDIKKVVGFWVIDKIHDQDVETGKINRTWHVGGL